MKKIILSLSLICSGHMHAKNITTKDVAQDAINLAKTVTQEIATVADKFLLPVVAYHIGKQSLKTIGCPVSEHTANKTMLKKAGHGAVTLATGVALISIVHAALTTEKTRTFIAAHMPHLDRILQYLDQENIAMKIKRKKKAL